MKNRALYIQVESMIVDVIKSNDKGESKQICNDDIVASINCKVSEIREGAQREKKHYNSWYKGISGD
jgi:hypothetical protein